MQSCRRESATQQSPTQARWMSCWVADGQWHAATDEHRLARVLGVFLDWADECAEV
ncbi:MAG: Imm53 family immunity protein [Planctomycetia bacterium]